MKSLKLVALIAMFTACILSCVNDKTNSDMKDMKLKGKVKKLIETYTQPTLDLSNVQNPTWVNNETKSIYLFNEDGYILEKNVYKNGKYSFKLINKYDNNGKKTEDQYFYLKGDNSKSIYKYDDNGNAIEVRSYNSENVIISISTYKYDSKGKILEQINSSNNNRVGTKSIYQYDEKGNLIEEYFYTRNILIFKTIYTYDSNDNMVEYNTSYQDSYSSSRKIEYVNYDKKGNWLNSYTKNPNILDKDMKSTIESSIVREIEYY